MKYTKPDQENTTYYSPDETIKLKVWNPNAPEGASKYAEVNVMPRELDSVVKAYRDAGYKTERIASPYTSSIGAFLGGVLQGASSGFEEEIYGVLGGDEVQKEAEKQRQREMDERPAARMAGEVVGSIIGAPARIEAMGVKAASKVGPMAGRAIGALIGAAEGAVSAIASKPMGEKEDVTWGDIVVTGIASLLGGLFPPKNVKVDKKTINAVKENVEDSLDEGKITPNQRNEVLQQLSELETQIERVYIDPTSLQKEVLDKDLPIYQMGRPAKSKATDNYTRMIEDIRSAAESFIIKRNQKKVPPTVLQLVLDNSSMDKLPFRIDTVRGKGITRKEDIRDWTLELEKLLTEQKPSLLQMRRLQKFTGIDNETINKIIRFYDEASEDLKMFGRPEVEIGKPSPQVKIIHVPPQE